ncbi:hypothetical protein JAAARDRAFT_28774 [Jaapia argillacea MUCL 33604]|uniref:Protein BIG1 n=1 Tax=Jaapia argillacea MUCL 33604 TaxID=933084 RepID=A0A067QDH2_9AGAM|nr:hypothetical protein JAAARDRAFT_28774 [Jaapia argillacea MUCL 33604]
MLTLAARALVVGLLPLAFAFSDSVPLVAWSSHRSVALDSLPSTLPKGTHHDSILASVLNGNDICDNDLVVVVTQPGLHASDLRGLPSSSHTRRRLADAPSSIELPYVRYSSTSPLSHIAAVVSERCGSHAVTVNFGELDLETKPTGKHVVCMDMPSLEEVAGPRRSAMIHQESLLSSELERLTSAFPNHLVIFTGTFPSLHRRQIPDASEVDSPASSISARPAFAPSNSTLPAGGLLKRYQILTPALITTLLIAFFIMVPVVMLGVYALASIQAPIREPLKNFSAQDKKNQ